MCDKSANLLIHLLQYGRNAFMHQSFVSPAPLGQGIAETQRG